MKSHRFFSSVAAGLILCALSGCDQLQKQQKTRAFDRGVQAAKDGSYEDARAAYEEALDGTPASAEAYYHLALLEDDKLDDLTGAIYHYQRFLVLGKGGNAKELQDAKRFLESSKFKLVTQLSTGALISQKDAARLRNENLVLNKKIIDLSTQMGQLRDQRDAAIKQARNARSKSPSAVAPTPEKITPGMRTYVVQKGDTLDSLARHFYQSSARWQDILDANFYRLNGKTNLKLGETLIIPQ